jgi:hypothetical protein
MAPRDSRRPRIAGETTGIAASLAATGSAADRNARRNAEVTTFCGVTIFGVVIAIGVGVERPRTKLRPDEIIGTGESGRGSSSAGSYRTFSGM